MDCDKFEPLLLDELYEELEQCRPEVLARLVFMTGASNTPAFERFLAKHHRVRVLSKPFGPGSIDALVEESLAPVSCVP